VERNITDEKISLLSIFPSELKLRVYFTLCLSVAGHEARKLETTMDGSRRADRAEFQRRY
jgi:hypothetical protein